MSEYTWPPKENNLNEEKPISLKDDGKECNIDILKFKGKGTGTVIMKPSAVSENTPTVVTPVLGIPFRGCVNEVKKGKKVSISKEEYEKYELYKLRMESGAILISKEQYIQFNTYKDYVDDFIYNLSICNIPKQQDKQGV